MTDKTPPLVTVQVHRATREALAAVRADMRQKAQGPVTFDETVKALIQFKEDATRGLSPQNEDD